MRKRGKLAYLREILHNYPEIIAKPEPLWSPNESRRVQIVRQTLDIIDHMPDSRSRRKLIDLTYFSHRYTLGGAAFQIPVSERTAQRWNAELMRLMAEQMDLP